MEEMFGEAGLDLTAIMNHVQEIERQFSTLREHLADRNDSAGVAMLDSLKVKIETLSPAEMMKGEEPNA